ncbi:response regulator transcription factor [Methylobrevis pamukkalensis]|uniref:response regulator transcription factor n=1 Tax=Methylobrevis pamukkalensis TaxID=1439726 RepID=UPI001AECF207|nr:response regulator [Methylobrevis pamukkalensis]
MAIVDDDPDVLAGLGRLTRTLGYQTRLYESAAAFLATSTGEPPCCVLIDLQMPGMDGIDLIEVVAARVPALPVVAMTAFPNDAVRQRALRAGATAYLTKPFDVDLLETYLAQIVAKRDG